MINRICQWLLLIFITCCIPVFGAAGKKPMTPKGVKAIFGTAYAMSSAEVSFLSVAPLLDPESPFQKEIADARDKYKRATGGKLDKEHAQRYSEYIFYVAAVGKYPKQARQYLLDCDAAHKGALKNISALVGDVKSIGAPDWVTGFLKSSYGSIEEFLNTLEKGGSSENISKEGMAASLRWCVENARVAASLPDLLNEVWVRDFLADNYGNGGEIEWFYQAGLVLPLWTAYEKIEDQMLLFWLTVTTQSLGSDESGALTGVPKSAVKNFNDLNNYVDEQMDDVKGDKLKIFQDIQDRTELIKEIILKN
ncbi:MAG: hypothetical protein AB1546_12510 [bacterium]